VAAGGVEPPVRQGRGQLEGWIARAAADPGLPELLDGYRLGDGLQFGGREGLVGAAEPATQGTATGAQDHEQKREQATDHDH
ncbi:hypothetical protein RZS08_20140, partial [Arthrospira platensis SPKY1]|nr:hypothetical protein [Arthrospira platensis SPKY1]